MVDFINISRKTGGKISETIAMAGRVRFRPILLTSLTTFAGLTPLLLERSLQAKFLIPMAVSLGFGVLFATVISLVMVPVGYLILEDIRSLFGSPAEEEKETGAPPALEPAAPPAPPPQQR